VSRRRGIVAGLAILAVAAITPAAETLRVDGAAALRHVERLVAIGPRVAGTPGAERARAYITGELKKLDVKVEVRTFDADTPHGRLKLANVIAVVPGRRSDVILLGGHYDTKYFK
jgi:acetylornithine deacetylase/succinyl-diaminopimelate desuccinylase-like protein